MFFIKLTFTGYLIYYLRIIFLINIIMSENSDVYIDLLLLNSIQTNSNHRVQVNFMQNSSQPILKSTNGYKLSIIRFALNTETLPIFIPTIQSKNKTIYSITMGFDGIYFQQFMNFEPQNLNPVDPDEYYYVYNYQYLIYLVNKCLFHVWLV